MAQGLKGQCMTEWLVTGHAREQMEERGITKDQLDALLARPTLSIPDPKGQPNCRYYTGGGILAVVDEVDRAVITVGINGASKRDWRTFAAPASPPPPEPVRFRKQRRKRIKDAELPVTKTSVLDGVHPGIAADVRAYLDEHGLDFRAVRVVSPTEVFIDPPEAS